MKLPVICPSCENSLRVSQMKCDRCETEVNGNYDLPLYLKLSREEQDFILEFFFRVVASKKWLNKQEIHILPCGTKWMT
jgi:hypothetical protein